MKKVFVSGCYDLLHSGHVEFFKQAAEYGDLYVGLGSDATILGYKHHKPMFPESERLFMVKAVRYVKDAFINDGSGIMDFIGTVDRLQPDIFIVNADGGSPEKEAFCKERGIEYVVLQRTPHEGLEARSSTDIKKMMAEGNTAGQPAGRCSIPTRIDIAGTWIDQPYVSCFHPGWALTLSIEPTFDIKDRCGLSTSTREQIRRIWPYRLPNMDPETLARLVFCFENHPEREGGHISGAQDSIGICVPGLSRHYYDNHFWPERIETCTDASVLDWLESHLCLILTWPRPEGCSVVAGKDITPSKVEALAKAADDCWNASMAKNLEAFAKAYRDSFNAQTAMFPGMIDPEVDGKPCPEASVRPDIEKWSGTPGVLAWKLTGAGGGGYLALVVDDAAAFVAAHPEGIGVKIRKENI